jgi:hypothetical protein
MNQLSSIVLKLRGTNEDLRIEVKIPVILASLTVVAFSLVACAGATGSPRPTSTGAIEIKLAPIHELGVRFAESFPVQVFLYVKGGLPDGCTKFHGFEITNRSGNAIKIEMTVERPRDAVCTAIYGYFDQNINLGTDFKSDEKYTVAVNDKTIDFTMP